MENKNKIPLSERNLSPYIIKKFCEKVRKAAMDKKKSKEDEKKL
jgi:hypothetical protein